MSIKNVILIGAGGNLGPAVLDQFLISSFTVTVLSRKESKSTFPSSVKVIKTDYSPESLAQAFKGQDAVVSIVGNEGFGQQTTIIDAAIKAGVKRFIPSEYGSDTNNDEVVKIVPIFKGKTQIVKYLTSKESKDFSWTALITGPFFDWGLKIGFLGFNFKDHTAEIWDSGSAPFSTTNLPTIGLSLVKILSTESNLKATANKYIYVASHTVSQNDILKAVEKITGSKWNVTSFSSKEVIPAELEKLGKHDYSGVMKLIQAAAFGDGGLGDFGKVEGGVWNEKLGLPKENFEEDLKKFL
ncbi:NAD(P)-binding protein [Tothia fuscella]|uniref:NAD(P)-binding protein n=1 Tax=Tothia fuscella TaxID=1048955 RepID=A0A9P4U050_9PEZI|nr:NAD(P)-binding protein [Tothia fuscella]